MVFKILALITGAIIVILGIFVYIFPKRSTTLIIKMASDIASCLNGVFIYFATGNVVIFATVATCAIGVFRDVVYGLRSKYKICNYYSWAVLFVLLNLGALVITYESPISLLPVIGTVVSCLTLYFRDQRISKSGAIFCQIMNIIYYSVLLESSDILTIFSLTAAVTTLTGSTIGLIYILFFKKNKEKIVHNGNEKGNI